VDLNSVTTVYNLSRIVESRIKPHTTIHRADSFNRGGANEVSDTALGVTSLNRDVLERSTIDWLIGTLFIR
jgi:hypothetical protein